MARNAEQISNPAGIAAASFVVVAVLLAFVGIGSRINTVSGLGPAEWQAIRFTIWQSFLSALVSCALAIPVARALTRRRFWGRNFLITLLGAPFILPVIVAMLGLLAIFGRSGFLNDILEMLGIAKISIYGLQGVILAHVFFNLPLATRLLIQGWHAVPAERFRLAAQLGLRSGMMFRLIELPLLLRIVPGAFALIFVICLTSFAVALTLGGGPGATTIELAIYQAFRFDFNLGKAALLSLVQLCVAGAAAGVAFWLIPSVSFGGGLDRMQMRWDVTGGTTLFLDRFYIAIATSFLLLPLLAIVVSGVAGITLVPWSVWTTAWTSLWVALVSVMVLLGLALPMAGWIAMSKRTSVEAIGLLGLAVSPLMIGTGWFILIHPFANPTDWALMVTISVNALMALPFALRILVPSLRETVQTYGRLSGALGISGLTMWLRVLLPRSRPQIGFAAGLTAALSVGDLGVIALFGDPDRATLPLQMYRLIGSYRTDAAAGAALILLVLAFGLFWIMDYWGRCNAIAE
jgi:thiamine transport system permease protein